MTAGVLKTVATFATCCASFATTMLFNKSFGAAAASADNPVASLAFLPGHTVLVYSASKRELEWL
jgi:hypothetical protein